MEVANGVSLKIPPVPFNLPLLFALRGGVHMMVVFSKSRLMCQKTSFKQAPSPLQGLQPRKPLRLSQGDLIGFPHKVHDVHLCLARVLVVGWMLLIKELVESGALDLQEEGYHEFEA